MSILLKGAKTSKLEFRWIRCHWQEDHDEVSHCFSTFRGDSWLHSYRCLGTCQDGIGGIHYFVSFIDDFSKRCWVYTMRHKRKVLNLFVELNKHTKKHTEKRSRYSIRIMVVSTVMLFLQLCCDEEIERHFIFRETPQQNGSGREDESDLAGECSMHVINFWIVKIL